MTYRNKNYTECIPDSLDPLKSWCSTKVDHRGRHVGAGRGNWGYCDCVEDMKMDNVTTEKKEKEGEEDEYEESFLSGQVERFAVVKYSMYLVTVKQNVFSLLVFQWLVPSAVIGCPIQPIRSAGTR